jgi:hypothetical protein
MGKAPKRAVSATSGMFAQPPHRSIAMCRKLAIPSGFHIAMRRPDLGDSQFAVEFWG